MIQSPPVQHGEITGNLLPLLEDFGAINVYNFYLCCILNFLILIPSIYQKYLFLERQHQKLIWHGQGSRRSFRRVLALVDTLIAAGVSVPDSIGELTNGSRIIGCAELGWSKQNVWVTDDDTLLQENLIFWDLTTANIPAVVAEIITRLERERGITHEYKFGKRVSYDQGCLKSVRKLPDYVSGKFLDLIPVYG